MLLNIMDEASRLPQSFLPFLQSAGDKSLAVEGLSLPVQATLLVTDDQGIRALNERMRGIDRATDVLSFPAARFKGGTAGQNPAPLRRERDPETGLSHLGDIAVSMPRAREQADAFGHSLAREVCYLFVHGMLHLMGHDHETDAERAAMRVLEERIMDKTGLTRELTDADIELIREARDAMERAYAPYSGYRVGACVRTRDGRVFLGCNVENASFGLTICAERNAITTAVAQGAREIDAIAIAAEGAMPYPCGACRQFIREFAEDAVVLVANGDGVVRTTLSALLPCSFGPDSIYA